MEAKEGGGGMAREKERKRREVRREGEVFFSELQVFSQQLYVGRKRMACLDMRDSVSGHIQLNFKQYSTRTDRQTDKALLITLHLTENKCSDNLAQLKIEWRVKDLNPMCTRLGKHFWGTTFLLLEPGSGIRMAAEIQCAA